MKTVLLIQGYEALVELLRNDYNVLYAPSYEHVDLCYDLLDQVDAVVFSRYRNTQPAMYDQQLHPELLNIATSSEEDDILISIWSECISRDLPMIGIGGGAQFLSVMGGLPLVQYCNGHYGSHRIKTNQGEVMKCTSAHRQIVNINGAKPEDISLKAWAIGTDVTISETMPLLHSTEFSPIPVTLKYEPEVWELRKLKTLCIQGHPEYESATLQYKTFCLNQIQDLLLKQESKVCAA